MTALEAALVTLQSTPVPTPRNATNCIVGGTESAINCSAYAYTDLLGVQVAMLMLWVPLLGALGIQSRSLSIPAILLAMFPGFIIGGLPPGAALAAAVLLTVAVTLAYRSIAD
jgi:hypothetical protein